MKRTPLKRKTALKARGKSRFPKRRAPKYVAWIRKQSCSMLGKIVNNYYHVCLGPVEAAHLKSRGAGGGDRENCLSLCSFSHGTQHTIGLKSWAALYRMTVEDLKAIARALDARYRREREGT